MNDQPYQNTPSGTPPPPGPGYTYYPDSNAQVPPVAPQGYQQQEYQQPGYQQPGYTPSPAYGQTTSEYGQSESGYMPPGVGYAQPVYPGIMYAQRQADPGRGLAITGFILGIVGIFLSWFPILNIIISILGVIFSAVGQKSVTIRGLAIAGLVLSIAATLLSLLFLFVEHII